MRTLPTTIVALLSVALLAGCAQETDSAPAEISSPSSASSSGGQDSPEQAIESSTPQTDMSLSEIADGLGCLDYALAATMAPGAAEYGTCQLDGVRVQLYRFADLDDKQVFLDQVKAYGVVESQLAQTDDGLIAAAPADQRLLAQLQTALAG